MQVIRESGGVRRIATPMYVFSEKRDERLRQFAQSDTSTWSLAEARRLTPPPLTPDGLRAAAGLPSPDDVVLEAYQDIAPPQLLERLYRLGLEWERISMPVTRRWWTRVLARNRKLDVVRELRRARRAHRLLAACFPRSVRKRHPFFALEFERQNALAIRLPQGESVERLWDDLSGGLLRLVEFRKSYLATRFAVFATRFAARTEFGAEFFSRLGTALLKTGELSRRDMVNAERWELLRPRSCSPGAVLPHAQAGSQGDRELRVPSPSSPARSREHAQVA